MQRRSYTSDEGWLLSYADLITLLLVFFAMLLGAAEISRARMQQIAAELSGEDPPASLASIQDEIEEQIEEKGLEDEIRTELTDDGLKLFLNSGLMFDSGSALIRTEQEPLLDDMLQTLVPYGGNYLFAIEGHTDSSGSDSYNQLLSERRASSVRDFLLNQGIEPKRTRAVGYGERYPLASNDNAAGREQNRRVELTLVPMQ